jgi:hypothetical protein
MNKFAIMAAVAAAALMAAPMSAHAQSYVGLGYTQFDFDGGEVDAVTRGLATNSIRTLRLKAKVPLAFLTTTPSN